MFHKSLHVVVLLSLLGLGLASCGENTQVKEERADQQIAEQWLSEGRNHMDPFVRAETATLLSYAPPGTWEIDVESMLTDPDSLVVLAAAQSLLRVGVKDRAVETMKKLMTLGDAPERLAVLQLSARYLGFEERVELITLGLNGDLPEVRQEPMVKLVQVLTDKPEPEPEKARKLEEKLKSFTMDPDRVVAGYALGYLGSVGRLTKESRELRAVLYEVAEKGAPNDQLRAMQILIQLRDPKLKTIAHDIYLKSTGVEEKKTINEYALIALGISGDEFRLKELDTLARRDSNKEIQLTAIDALSFVDDIEAKASLNQSLDNPDLEVVKRALHGLLDSPTGARVPDSLLRSESLEVRVLALKLLWLESPSRFTKMISQKIGVEQFRGPILTALNEWSNEPPVAAEPPKWLTSLSGPLHDLELRASEFPKLAVDLYDLLIKLGELSDYISQVETLPYGGQYIVLRRALETQTNAKRFCKQTILSPYFAVKAVSAVCLLSE